jgi:biopolymer transport protein ExbD
MRKKRRDLGQTSDIAFLLIIFFLLLSGISSSHSLSLQLPQNPTASTSSEDSKLQTITLIRNGTLLLNNQETPLSQLPSLVYRTTDLILEVEAETAWQKVVSTLSVLQQLQPASLELEMMP